ncbi:MAG TPA: hypothetical protein VM756_13295, partial [Burkholderiales bacterium]|nr:hypothetical protein [Burkholderiales bacterium]
ALNAVAIDPNNPNIAYVGSPNGGVWKTTNFLNTIQVDNPQGGKITVPAPTWTPMTDLNQSLSIAALAIDPANSNIIYAGTGNVSNSHQSGTLVGLLKSSDAGQTWTTISSGVFKDVRVFSIQIFHGAPGDKLLVATSGGLYSAGLNGENAAKVAGGLPDGIVTDVVRFSNSSNTVWAAVAGMGVYESTNRGVGWTLKQSMPLSQRIKLAVGTDGTLYAAEIGIHVLVTGQGGAGQNVIDLNNVANIGADTQIRLYKFSTVVSVAMTTTITLDDTTDLDASGSLTIGTGADAETVTYASFIGNVVTLSADLTKAHAANAPVTAPGNSTAFNATLAIATGPMEVTLADATGFVASGVAQIGLSGNAESARIQSISGNVLTIAVKLANVHAAGEPVQELLQTVQHPTTKITAVAGARQITLENAAGIRANDTITIGSGTSAQVVDVLSVAGNVVTLKADRAVANGVDAAVTKVLTVNSATRITLGSLINFDLAAGNSAITFGDTRLVALWKLGNTAGVTAANFTAVPVPTTADPDGRIWGLQKTQGEKNFSMTVDPENSSIIYLGGTLEPTVSYSTLTIVAAVTATGGNTIKVESVTGIQAGQTLILEPGEANQESVLVASTTAGTEEAIRGGIAAGQPVVHVFDASGFAANDPVVIQGGNNLEIGAVQSTTNRANTATTPFEIFAAGRTTLKLNSVANWVVGDRLIIFEGDNVETATVLEISAATKEVKITTADPAAPVKGLAAQYTTAASVRVLSTVTLAANLSNRYTAGTISTFATITLAPGTPLSKTHVANSKIRINLTHAGNLDWTARIFKVDSTNAGNNTLLVSAFASGGGWNGKSPSSPHGDSRTLSVLIHNNVKYLIET